MTNYSKTNLPTSESSAYFDMLGVNRNQMWQIDYVVGKDHTGDIFLQEAARIGEYREGTDVWIIGVEVGVNLPKDFSLKVVKSVAQLAFDHGCKGNLVGKVLPVGAEKLIFLQRLYERKGATIFSIQGEVFVKVPIIEVLGWDVETINFE